MAGIEKTVFISYRRADVFIALSVYDHLTRQGYDVFFDYKSIPSGDFEQVIISNIKARAHFLVILTPNALDRCNQPGDWMRREIETAMDEKRNIIPLFFKGFRFDSCRVARRLKGKLGNLKSYNGMNVHEDFFDAAMERLRERFLDVPLETVLHPISHDVQEEVKKQQDAANDALRGGRAVGHGRRSNFKPYLFGMSIFIALVLAAIGINNLINGGNDTATPPASHPFTPVASKTPPATKDGMVLAYVPASGFTMGSNDGADNEKEPHLVYLDAFWMDQTEVTNAMYAKCVNAQVCEPPHSVVSSKYENYYISPLYSDYPVIQVSWIDAKTYCEWAGRRLPTEAEWEKAARSTDERTYPWGNVVDQTYANYNGFVGDTKEVGSYEKGISRYGVYDMAGNVAEWVSSLYIREYPYKPNDGRENLDASGNRVVRGGSWYGQGVGGDYIRTTYRGFFSPTTYNNYTGFRCAMDALE